MELFIVARFHARPGEEKAVAEAILDNLPPSRGEPGRLNIHAFRSIRDPRLFFVHSGWKDEAAFENHAGLPYTVRFLERVEPLIDQLSTSTARSESARWPEGTSFGRKLLPTVVGAWSRAIVARSL
jgi:quinol monooxygenase YgiN